LPHPGIYFKAHPKLGELYFVNTLNNQFLDIFEIELHQSTSDHDELMTELNELLFKYRNENTKIRVYSMLIHNDIFGSIESINEFVEGAIKGQYLLYEKFKTFRKRNPRICCRYFEKLPYSVLFSEISKATDYYLAGNFKALDNMISIFKDLKVETVDSKLEKTCRQCGKPESVRKLITCEECIKDQYPDIHYFCGRRCQEIRWKSEHFAEHLEFELGLSDFNK
jgi:hypothetical protein